MGSALLPEKRKVKHGKRDLEKYSLLNISRGVSYLKFYPWRVFPILYTNLMGSKGKINFGKRKKKF